MIKKISDLLAKFTTLLDVNRPSSKYTRKFMTNLLCVLFKKYY